MTPKEQIDATVAWGDYWYWGDDMPCPVYVPRRGEYSLHLSCLPRYPVVERIEAQRKRAGEGQSMSGQACFPRDPETPQGAGAS